MVRLSLMPKIIVTGGCGFIGPELCRQLVRSGAEVVVVDNLGVGAAANLAVEVELVEQDIRDAERLERSIRGTNAEVLVHLAAIHFIPACEADPPGAIRTNVEGTQAVLQACAAAGTIGSVVVASSGAVYAPSTGAQREDDPLAPTDVYGHTKRWTEELAALFNERTGIGVTIARIFNTFGPGETNPHLIPTLISQLREGPSLSVGTLTTRRDYVFVGDVAAALARMATRARDGCRTLNVCRGEAVEGNEIVRLLGELMDVRPDVKVDPARVRSDDRPQLVGDPARATAELGWTAATGLRDGLEAAIERPVSATFRPFEASR